MERRIMQQQNGTFPTPYNEVNTAIRAVRDGAVEVLGAGMTDMYLYGSLALGDFNPGRSDIDFVIVVSDILSEGTINRLKVMHSDVWERNIPWADRLEGVYISGNVIREHTPHGPACLMLNEKQFFFAPVEHDWILNRDILYKHGVTVCGPSPQELIAPVAPEQLKETVIKELQERWRPFAENPDLFNRPHYQPFVVLTICRALYTYVHERVAGKTASMKWAEQTLPGEWTALITAAGAWEYGMPSGDIPRTQDFIRYAMRKTGITG